MTQINHFKGLAHLDNLHRKIVIWTIHFGRGLAGPLGRFRFAKRDYHLDRLLYKRPANPDYLQSKIFILRPHCAKDRLFWMNRVIYEKEIIIRTIKFATGLFIWINGIICKNDFGTGLPFCNPFGWSRTFATKTCPTVLSSLHDDVID